MTPIAAILGGWEIILILAAFCVVAVILGGIALAIYFATRKSKNPSAQRPPPVAQTVRPAQPPPIPTTQRSQPTVSLRSDSPAAPPPPEHISSTASADSVSSSRRLGTSYVVVGISILIALFAAWYWWPDRPEPGQTCRYTVNFKFDHPKFTDCLIDCNPNLYCIMDIEGVGRYLMPVYTKNYAGQEVMMSLEAPRVPNRSKIIVNLFDGNEKMRALCGQIGSIAYKINVSGQLTSSIRVNGDFIVQLIPKGVDLWRDDFVAQGVFITSKLSSTYERTLIDKAGKSECGFFQLSVKD